MKAVFISNYLNYHQILFSSAMCRVLEKYYFVQTEEMNEKGKKLGYGFDDILLLITPVYNFF